ncbi:uncharacterized protein LOC134235378 [Saccostrea cucullata]|uniref:uncharacterized protein LOC134235378 n=1 Tax=Saccostrea cuccullata TaxID=36930 RepID=UPI002ED29A58
MAASKPKYPQGFSQEHIEMCKTHDLPLDMLCEDCDEFICGKCAKTDHRDHEWSTIPTAAQQRRRGLLSFLKRIKEKDLSRVDEKMEKMSQQITENKEICDSEIKKLQKHVDEIMARLKEIRKCHEKTLRDDLKKSNEKVDSFKYELNRKKKEIVETVQFMEENNNTMSDYGFLDNHRDLIKMLSGLDVDMKCSTPSMRYSKGDASDAVLEKLIGKIFDLDGISLTEKSSFEYGKETVFFMRALCDDECCIKQLSGDIEQINKEGVRKHKYNTAAGDMCVTDTGDVYFTLSSNDSINHLSPSGSVSTIISTYPLSPLAICYSRNGGLLVTLRDNISYHFELNSHSKRLVRHITVTGDVIHEYEYQEDGQTRLFTLPYRVTQNSNCDICVVNSTSIKTGNIVIMSPSGRMKSVYRGQNLTENFKPLDVVCDSHCNILVTNRHDKHIHLLSPDGEFLKFLLTDNKVYHPSKLSLYKSTLWVGYQERLVKVFQYSVKI